QQLTDEGMSLAIASVSSTVKTAAFQDDFKSRWGINGSWVLNSESVVATSPTTVPARTDDLKPGVRLSISGMEKGNILPMEYSWTLDYDQLSKLLDRNVTSLPSAAELAKVMRIDFENLRSVRVPVIDGSNGGTFNIATAQFDKVGVSAVDAALTGALRVQQATNSATISLTVHLANVDDANNKGAQLVQRLLVVPDGVADNAISGTMWLSKKAETSSNNNDSNNGNGGGGGGGGGCDAAGLGLAVLLLALPLLARRRR
ncbi:MAG: SYNERG-CTERM sorting domain-containing protein, partial [Fretibacterium sp.]|nr:SYNERG-CTERM sorting domain-containing protein [Fretibacterium sp.]